MRKAARKLLFRDKQRQLDVNPPEARWALRQMVICPTAGRWERPAGEPLSKFPVALRRTLPSGPPIRHFGGPPEALRLCFAGEAIVVLRFIVEVGKFRKHFRKNRNFRKLRKSEYVCGLGKCKVADLLLRKHFRKRKYVRKLSVLKHVFLRGYAHRPENAACPPALMTPGLTATEGTNSTRLSNKMRKDLESWCSEKQRNKLLEQAMFPALSHVAWVDVFVKVQHCHTQLCNC
ncbi:hypothetical protein GWK47_032927 [Chionoecetes opilio]|uniref:Uncharacterized protein n=1 Tax=Chionoecetes opilio TaxID=41210 RepID=A0A8J4YVS1_CHIOP|nr:hypothetical protein GWK47_032927 [Chionoecetes opilio]